MGGVAEPPTPQRPRSRRSSLHYRPPWLPLRHSALRPRQWCLPPRYFRRFRPTAAPWGGMFCCPPAPAVPPPAAVIGALTPPPLPPRGRDRVRSTPRNLRSQRCPTTAFRRRTRRRLFEKRGGGRIRERNATETVVPAMRRLCTLGLGHLGRPAAIARQPHLSHLPDARVKALRELAQRGTDRDVQAAPSSRSTAETPRERLQSPPACKVGRLCGANGKAVDGDGSKPPKPSEVAARRRLMSRLVQHTPARRRTCCFRHPPRMWRSNVGFGTSPVRSAMPSTSPAPRCSIARHPCLQARSSGRRLPPG
jgi:hypothetical protein